MSPNVEAPRIWVGDQTRFTLIDKAPKPYGIFFLHTSSERLMQWLGDHWEIVAQGALGDPTRPRLEELTPNELAAGIRSGAGAGEGFGPGAGGGAGGGGISPAPRVAGDPSLTSGMPGGSPVGFGARIFPNTTQNIAHNSEEDVELLLTSFDDAGFVQPFVGTDATQMFQIPAGKAGLYRVSFQVSLDPTGTTDQRGRVRIIHAGSETAMENTHDPVVAQVAAWRASRLIRLAVGNTVNFMFLQTNSGALAKNLHSVVATRAGRTFAEIEYLGT